MTARAPRLTDYGSKRFADINASRGTQRQMLDPSLIDPDPDQPRKTVSKRIRETLNKSAVKYGLKLPIVVRSHPDQPDRYMIVDGHLRWAAAKQAGQEIPVIFVRADTAVSLLEYRLIANTQREGMHKLETGQAVLELLELLVQQWGTPAPLEVLLERLAAQERPEANGRSMTKKQGLEVEQFLTQHGAELREVIQQFANSGLRHFYQSIVQIRSHAPEVFAQAIEHNLSVRVADELRKVSDKPLRNKLLKQAISEQWSYAQTKQAINTAQPKPIQGKADANVRLLRDFARNYDQLDTATRAKLDKFLRELQVGRTGKKSVDQSTKTMKARKTPSQRMNSSLSLN